MTVHNRLETFKPAAPASVHLLLAALLWTTVGGLMAFFGVRWVLAGAGPHTWVLLTGALLVGVLKARYVLVRTARRMITRIQARGDGRCIGGFLSLRTWGFVAVMAGGGRLLRSGLLPRSVVGVLYTAIGTALLLAAITLWQAWLGHDAQRGNVAE